MPGSESYAVSTPLLHLESPGESGGESEAELAMIRRCSGEAGWWGRGDLNPGPPPCKGGVLTRLDDGPLHSSRSFKALIIVSVCKTLTS